MATEKFTKMHQSIATVDKKIEVRRNRATGQKTIIQLDPHTGMKISNSTDLDIFTFDLATGRLTLKGRNDVCTGILSAGVNGGGSSLSLDDETGKTAISIRSDNKTLSMYNSVSTAASVKLDGEAGTIYAANADLAENFACSQKYDDSPDEGYGQILDPIEPGDVLVISEDGTLVKCEREYDTRVAGVVSGAKDYKPAIVLDEFDLPGTQENFPGKGVFPVALAGKVYCKVVGDVKPGDLLVTSSVKGAAMALDKDKRGAFFPGTILGKALAPTKRMRGMDHAFIPIIVMLG